jgi:hypothetical protein
MNNGIVFRLVICVFLSNSFGLSAISLISNGGFESGDKSNWALDFDNTNPGKWIVTTFLPQSGSYSLFADNWPKYISQTFSTNVSKTELIDFKFWTLTSSSTSDTPILNVRLNFVDGTSQSILNKNILLNTWEQQDILPYIQSANITKLVSGFSALVYGASNPYAIDSYYDSFNITASVPEPSAVSLLAVGLGGLGMMRRRRS